MTVGDVALGERSGTMTVRRGKRGYSRMVPVPREARRAVAAWLEQHPEADREDSALWWGERGPLGSRSAIYRGVQAVGELAGLDVSPHILRHTFATQYLAANPDDVRGLAALLGHKTLTTTMRYTEPSLADLAGRVERVG